MIVRIETKDGLVGRILIDNGLGYLQVLKWKGWPVRAYPFRKWLLNMKMNGATFRLNGRGLEVRYHGMFRRTTQRTECAAGCGVPIVWRGDYAVTHGPPHYHPGCRARVMRPGLRTRFKKGFVPWNKGKHYTAPGSEKGWFKKGVRTRWNGGVSRNQGYLYALTPDPNDVYPCGMRRRVNVARDTLERLLGRKLDPRNEVVLHMDHNRSNNDPLNLRVVTRRDSINLNRARLTRGRAIPAMVCPRCHSTGKRPGEACGNCGRTAQGYLLVRA